MAKAIAPTARLAILPLRIGHWTLGFHWDLGFEHWDFPSRIAQRNHPKLALQPSRAL
jgi:hypothetical protein